MTRLVMKFGGTSVADMERIARVARLVIAEQRAGHSVAVVVSAMAGQTNQLVAWTDAAGRAAQDVPASDDEYDLVVASGEQVTAGLLSMTLRAMGHRARSWVGWQIPIITDDAHGSARIEDVPADALGAAIDGGEIAVIAGFQGVTQGGRITTLGTRRFGHIGGRHRRRAEGHPLRHLHRRGRGLYHRPAHRAARAPPRQDFLRGNAGNGLPRGPRCCRPARWSSPCPSAWPLRVLSSFIEPGEAGADTGTIVCDEEEIVEKRIVSGVAYSRDEAKITLLGLPDHPGVSSKIFSTLADANVNVDMIVQSRARTSPTPPT